MHNLCRTCILGFRSRSDDIFPYCLAMHGRFESLSDLHIAIRRRGVAHLSDSLLALQPKYHAKLHFGFLLGGEDFTSPEWRRKHYVVGFKEGVRYCSDNGEMGYNYLNQLPFTSHATTIHQLKRLRLTTVLLGGSIPEITSMTM